MSDEIDVRVTPALHPEVVRQIEGYGDSEIKAYLAPVETAFSAAYLDLGSIHDAKAAADKNPVLNPAGRLLAVDDFAEKKLGKLTRTFDSLHASIGKSISSIEADLSKPVEAKGAASVAAEVRAHLRALSLDERMKVVREAIQGGDDRVASAALGAPAMLSGLQPKMQEILLREYHQHHSPVQAKRLRALQAAQDLLGRNAPLVLSETYKAVGYLTDPKTQRKIYPAELRKARDAANKPFAGA